MMPILKMHAILIVANMLANEMDALGVVTGETLRMSVDSIGGVGLESSGVNVPIYRPIIGLEMDEVGQLARKASLSDESRGEEVSEGHSLSPEITSNTIQEIESSFRIHSILESALATRKMFPITPSDLSKQGLSSSDEYDSKLVQQRH
jgi:thiamine biosynthesis protein ThiI